MKINSKDLSINLIATAIAFILLPICSGTNYGAFAASSGVKKDSQAAGYTYNPAGKPDPFRPFVEKEQVVRKQVEKVPPVSIFPLQKLPLDQLELVGIASDAKRKLAIMETKENKGRFYPISLGTVIGLNRGKVVEIQNDRIIVEEINRGKKEQKVNRITIKLHKDNEEGSP